MNLIFEIDGSFQLTNSEQHGVYGAYCGADGASIRTLKYEEKDAVQKFSTAFAEIEQEVSVLIDAEKEDGFLRDDAVSISISLKDMQMPVHTFYPFYEAELSGLTGAYQVSQGMGGATGFFTAEQIFNQSELKSFGIISLKFGEDVLTFYANDHSRFQNIFYITHKNEKLYLSCAFWLEEVEQDEITLPEIKIISSGSMEEQLADAATEIAQKMNVHLTKAPVYQWCSWYYDYFHVTEEKIAAYVTDFKNCDYTKDLSCIQIDEGYSPALGDWLLPCDKFPQGLKPAFDKIKEAGYTPGIWVGVFMVGNRSELYRQHPDWMLRNLDGTTYIEMANYGELRAFGYEDEEYYVLDTSHPDAMEYVRTVFRTLYGWGARMFKTDFMFWGYKDSSRFLRHTPGKTSVEYFRDVLQVIREEIKDDSYWLGCIAPFLPFAGYADGIRIGNDVGCAWHGVYSPQNMITCLKGNIFANNILYQIDPDALVLRDFNSELTYKEVESLSFFSALAGGCIYTSDPVDKIGNDRQELFRVVKPDGIHKPQMPFLSEDREEIVLVHKNEKQEALIFVFNPTEHEITKLYDKRELGITASETCFHTNDGTPADVTPEKLLITLAPHESSLLKANRGDAIVWDKSKTIWENLY